MPGGREEADVTTSSADYARRFAGGVGAWFLEVQAKATLDLLAPWPGASVLDVGAGRFDPAEAKRLAAAVEIHELEPVG